MTPLVVVCVMITARWSASWFRGNPATQTISNKSWVVVQTSRRCLGTWYNGHVYCEGILHENVHVQEVFW